MSTLYLPPHVIAAERRRYDAELLARVEPKDPRALEWTAVLQRLDPGLFMVKAKDTIRSGTPLRPGFYHVLRQNPDAPTSVFPVHADGAYVEPTSRIVERLLAGDLRNPDVYRQVTQAEAKADAALERDKKLRREQRRQHLRENVNAATRTSVSMNDEMPWSQNASPTALRDARQRKT